MDEYYAALLVEIQPGIIETLEEHERLLTAAERLMEKGDALAFEERRLLALLVLLIESFESSAMRPGHSGGVSGENEDQTDDEADNESSDPSALPEPFETLQRLMQARGLELSDVAHFRGSGQRIGEILPSARQNFPLNALDGHHREHATLFQSRER